MAVWVRCRCWTWLVSRPREELPSKYQSQRASSTGVGSRNRWLGGFRDAQQSWVTHRHPLAPEPWEHGLQQGPLTSLAIRGEQKPVNVQGGIAQCVELFTSRKQRQARDRLCSSLSPFLLGETGGSGPRRTKDPLLLASRPSLSSFCFPSLRPIQTVQSFLLLPSTRGNSPALQLPGRHWLAVTKRPSSATRSLCPGKTQPWEEAPISVSEPPCTAFHTDLLKVAYDNQESWRSESWRTVLQKASRSISSLMHLYSKRLLLVNTLPFKTVSQTGQNQSRFTECKEEPSQKAPSGVLTSTASYFWPSCSYHCKILQRDNNIRDSKCPKGYTKVMVTSGAINLKMSQSAIALGMNAIRAASLL